MAFSNPFTGTPALVAERDFFYWPGISGETFPPTFTAGTGTAAYGASGAFPGVTATCGASTPAQVAWPAVPLYRPSSAAFTGITVSGRILISTMTAAGEVDVLPRLYATSSTWASLSFVNGGWYATDAAGATSALQSYALATWLAFSVAITAAGVQTFTVAGVAVAGSTAVVPDKAPAVRLQAVPTASQVAGAYLAQLQVTYS